MTGRGRAPRTITYARLPLPGGCHRYTVHVDGTVVGRVESSKRAMSSLPGRPRTTHKVWTAYNRAGRSVGVPRATRAEATDDLLATVGAPR